MSIEEKMRFLENSDERNYLYDLVEKFEEAACSKNNIIDFFIESIVLAEANGYTTLEYIKQDNIEN